MRDYIYGLMTDKISGPAASLVKVLLRLASYIYGAGLSFIKFLYRINVLPQRSLGRPVISVGNLTMGGVGKTPLVMMLCSYLRAQGRRPAVLLRGYGSPQQWGRMMNDEGLMLDAVFKNVPLGVGRDRVRSAQRINREFPVDVFILDDGLQQWRVKKDFNIIVIDATNPFGNLSLIPRGILREPVSGLAQADAIVITKCDGGQNNLAAIQRWLRFAKPDTVVVETIHQPESLTDAHGQELPGHLASLKNQSVASLCSIGDPLSFETALLNLEARVKTRFRFPDHHWYTPHEVERIIEECRRQDIQWLVTTRKDWVKLKDFTALRQSPLRAVTLNIKIKIIKGADEFFGRIDRLL